MSEHRERPPLRVRHESSRLLAAFLLVTHGVGLAVVFVIPLDWYLCAGLSAMVLAGLVYAMAVQVLFIAPRAVREATWSSDGTWTLTLVSGKQVEARLLPSTLVTPRLIVLNFRYGRWRFRAMVLPSDALNPDLARRLRVRLRLGNAENVSDADAPA